MTKPFTAIEDYGIIGNLNTVALVSKSGSIDFMCFPQFDSPSLFAALLDNEKGGCFAIHPQLREVTHKQLYLPETAILITRFFSDEGIAEITDFMPIVTDKQNFSIVRKVSTIRGNIAYRMECCPRFDYSRAKHTATMEEEQVLFRSDTIAIKLQSDCELNIHGGDVHASFSLAEGETACFMLEGMRHASVKEEKLQDHIQESFRTTHKFWKSWVAKSTYKGRWREMVHRSAITLKLLSSQQHGSVVAAATFGLPEEIGGERNWDYRYTWVRDAAFMMYAFLKLGFTEEATAFIDWIKERCMQSGMQLMYTIDGQVDIEECVLEHLSGYKNSKPVRIGNAAHQQFQLDIYGELIDTIFLFNHYGGAITYELWQKIEKLVEIVCEKWRLPDHGIWEIRSEEKEFLHSRLLCWVALDRGIKIAKHRSFPYPSNRWEDERNEIFNDIYKNFWNEEKQSFVQFKDSDQLDAAVLLMPLLRFISPFEEKWKKTMIAVEKELGTDVLVYRYHNNQDKIDGLDGKEGTFTMCSFWYVECLAKGGEVEKATEYFEKLLGYANHLGLFAEQIGMRGEHLGNFPQAFTHLSLISAALQLDKSLNI
jgi:GH15 family glucan-1,4-alpha-glucosidase